MNVLHGLCVALLLAAPMAHGSSTDPGKVIAGWVEKISLVEPALVIKAKLDTGAKTSSIHAVNVEPFMRDGDRWVKFDLLLEDDGKAMLYAPNNNYADYTLNACLELMQSPNAVVALADGGAHCNLICDASTPTWMLTHWCRDRQGAQLALPEVI